MKGLSVILWIMCFVVSLSVLAPPFFKNVDRRVNCTGYLERAANANTARLALDQMDKAIADIERRGWTKGSTRVFFDYPSCDLGYWYKNLSAARSELAAFPENSAPLDQSNLLMKLRETVTEQREDGDRLILPPMLTYYPNQRIWFVWFIVGPILALLLCIFAALFWDYRN